MTQQFDVILLQPPYMGVYDFWNVENLGMGYLASSLEKEGYTVHIIDALLLEWSVEETVQFILENPPKLLLGMSILSEGLYATGSSIVKYLREKGFDKHISWGSWFPTFWKEAILEQQILIDSIVIGEGEECITHLAYFLANQHWKVNSSSITKETKDNILCLQQNNNVFSLDDIPYPRRDYLKLANERYHLATIYTSRGCAHNRCTFCTVPNFYGRGKTYRYRTVNNVVGELKQLVEYGAKFVLFTDNDFIGLPPEGIQRAIDILEQASALNLPLRYYFDCSIKVVDKQAFQRLKELGLVAIFLGLESQSDRSLKRFGKGFRFDDIEKGVTILKELDIKIVPGWIMFERDSTLEEIEESIDFLHRLEPYNINYLKSLYLSKDTPMDRLYGKDVYRKGFNYKYLFQYPEVDLLVKIIMNDYLPEVLPFTYSFYPIWHKYLAGYGTEEKQQLFEFINRRIRELSLGFVTETIARIRARSLNGVMVSIINQVEEFKKLEQAILQLYT